MPAPGREAMDLVAIVLVGDNRIHKPDSLA
jgi:hypothetical protein